MSEESSGKEQDAQSRTQGSLMKLAEQPILLLFMLLLGGGGGSAITNLTTRNEGLSASDIEAVRSVVKEALLERDRLSSAELTTRDLTLRQACENLVQAHVKEYHGNN